MARPFAEQAGLARSLSDDVLRGLRTAAREALLPHYRNLAADDIGDKGHEELVTVADRKSEVLLSDLLTALLPEAVIVGEEAADADPSLLSRLGAPLCWIIDPLDGTANFARGYGPFGIMVALASEGRPIGGWIFEPLSERASWAVLGHGAHGHRLHHSVPERSKTQIAVSELLKKQEGLFKSVESRLSGNFDLVEMPRCAAYQYPAMIRREVPASMFYRTLPWDHAAGALLVAESGGKVARLDGSSYLVTDERTGLLAAVSPGLWDRIMSALNGTA